MQTLAYTCPNCGQPLRSLKHSMRDYFCRGCCTAVVVVDHLSCVYALPHASGSNVYCKLERLVAL